VYPAACVLVDGLWIIALMGREQVEPMNVLFWDVIPWHPDLFHARVELFEGRNNGWTDRSSKVSGKHQVVLPKLRRGSCGPDRCQRTDLRVKTCVREVFCIEVSVRSMFAVLMVPQLCYSVIRERGWVVWDKYAWW